MNPNLFVYGTLLSSAGHPNGERLQREARLLGTATIAGKLFNLGRYPGLVEDAASVGRVHGEVYALTAPAPSLAWLDAYEGIVPGDQTQNAYARVERRARLTAGEEVPVWVYVYLEPIEASRLIPGGRWVPAGG
jgi:gamma-glutamylcyclotransferase (GGCT)/AIG2-like uncharacterized protein YtfP